MAHTWGLALFRELTTVFGWEDRWLLRTSTFAVALVCWPLATVGRYSPCQSGRFLVCVDRKYRTPHTRPFRVRSTFAALKVEVPRLLPLLESKSGVEHLDVGRRRMVEVVLMCLPSDLPCLSDLRRNSQSPGPHRAFFHTIFSSLPRWRGG